MLGYNENFKVFYDLFFLFVKYQLNYYYKSYSDNIVDYSLRLFLLIIINILKLRFIYNFFFGIFVYCFFELDVGLNIEDVFNILIYVK